MLRSISYKGGVGRTSALVNVAVQQALRGNNIIILDFDLEAPGTYPYLKKLDPNYNENKEGLLEYLVASIERGKPPTLRDKAIDLSACLGNANGGHLWVINAGNTKDPSYTSRLEKLRWNEIFQKQFGELLLKNFRNQIMEEQCVPRRLVATEIFMDHVERDLCRIKTALITIASLI